MSKIKRDQNIEDFKVNRLPVFSKQELYALKADLEKYKYKKTLPNGIVLNLIDFEKYLKDQGALNKDGAVYINRIYPNSQVTYYEALDEKWRQLCILLSKVEYAKTMELQGLDEVAESMSKY